MFSVRYRKCDDLARVLWTAGFVPNATESNYKIVVRATDKTGKVQTAEVRPPYPDGATGYHMINI